MRARDSNPHPSALKALIQEAVRLEAQEGFVRILQGRLSLHHFAPASMRIFAPAVMLVPIADAAATFLLGGSVGEAAIHLLGTVAIGVLALCAWLDTSLDVSPTKRD